MITSTPLADANQLVSTTPISGSTISTAPSAVTITAQNTLMDMGNSVIVTDPTGHQVDDGTLSVADTSIMVGLPALSVPGIYTVTYSLLTDNDVPLEGSYQFTFNAPLIISSPSPAVTQSATPEPSATSTSSTSTFVIGMLFAAMLVFFFLIYYTVRIFRKR